MNTLQKNLIILAAATLPAMLPAAPYKVRLPLNDDDEGAMVYLVNPDNGEKIDSSPVVDKTAYFTGDIDEPIIAAAMLDDRRYGVFILESGSISFSPTTYEAFGSMLNDCMRELRHNIEALRKEYDATDSEAVRHEVGTRYQAMLDSTYNANSDNILGYYIQRKYINAGNAVPGIPPAEQ